MTKPMTEQTSKKTPIKRRKPTRLENVSLVMGTITLLVVFQFWFYLNEFTVVSPPLEKGLAQSWQVCVPKTLDAGDCTWEKKPIPSDLSPSQVKQFNGWVIYKTQFETPENCLSAAQACSFVFGEIGDAAEATLNGVGFGRHGSFPPEFTYAKHYPAVFPIPRNILKNDNLLNEVEIKVYSGKVAQTGIRRGPVGIMNSHNAFRFKQTRIIESILVPIFAAIALLVMGAVSLILMIYQHNQDKDFHYYARFCFAAGLFLISFSEVPREYTNLSLTGSIHFGLRVLFDWAFFELVCGFFRIRKKTVWILRPFYILFVLGFLVQVSVNLFSEFTGTSFSFDVAYIFMRIAFPLLLLPIILGLYETYKLKPSLDKKMFYFLFGILLPMQVADILVFHGFISNLYFVKFYPAFIGLAFGGMFFERYQKERAKILSEHEKSKNLMAVFRTTTEAAHDLLTPLDGLKMACESLKRNPNDKNLISTIANGFPSKVGRLEQTIQSMLKFSKEIKLNLVSYDLVTWFKTIVEETKQHSLAKNIEFKLEISNRSIKTKFDPTQLGRAITNVLNNSIEACHGSTNPAVTLKLDAPTKFSPWIVFTISDTGPGIPADIRERIFEPFVTKGKEGGTGLGLASTKRIVEAHQGYCEISNENSEGTIFRIYLPYSQNMEN